MSILLLAEIEAIWSALLISLIGMFPAFVGVWLLFWFIRSLLFKD